MLQVGRAPLHVAAETGNLESLIMLLNSGAHRAPRDRVSPSTPLMMHVTMYTMAFLSFMQCVLAYVPRLVSLQNLVGVG